jgi:hypothetical protein
MPPIKILLSSPMTFNATFGELQGPIRNPPMIKNLKRKKKRKENGWKRKGSKRKKLNKKLWKNKSNDNANCYSSNNSKPNWH